MSVRKNSLGLFALLVTCVGGLALSGPAQNWFSSNAMHQQTFIRTITGIVKDAGSRQPLSGVVVTEKGTQHAAVTGQDGRFSLQVDGRKVQLFTSYVGYESATTSVAAADSSVEILLHVTKERLEEVVVKGYSTQKRKSVTASVASSDRVYDMVMEQPVAEPLLGRVAGVQVQKRRTRKGDKGAALETEYNREGYAPMTENAFQEASQHPLSTFSIDVDAASYSNLRRYIRGGNLPPAGLVRSEELINYFDYEYEGPADDAPFAVHTQYMSCPWNPVHRLVSIGLQGRKVPTEKLPASNLVFLIDVSGSMMDENKLPLVKASLRLLTDQLREQDRVALVVYAGSAGLVLPSTSGMEKEKIKAAIDALEAGGSTAGGEGIRLAYETAKEQFRKNGNNRVILCTDGDFNVGESSDAAMEKLIEQERESGVFLTVLGYGMGNYQDAKMQVLAQKGNGNHAYIDGMAEAKKVLVQEFGGTLFTIAKDVKLQLEFNPVFVQAYRLIGYESRLLAKEDFNNDKKDAGDMGSGHTVTALYEIIPAGVANPFRDSVDALKYQSLPAKEPTVKSGAGNNAELLTVKLRYKQPDGHTSRLLSHILWQRDYVAFAQASENARFAAAVAEWGMLLNGSAFRQESSYEQVLTIASNAKGTDRQGYRREFIELVQKAKQLQDGRAARDSDH